MIHYYEHVRVDGVSAIKADRKNNPAVVSLGTRHVAPSENTPMSHNTKQQYSNPMANKPSTVNVPLTAQEINQVNNELDKMKPETIPSRPATVMDRPLENRPTIAELVAPETEDDRGDLSQEEIDG